MYSFNLKYIDTKNSYYKEAVAIREKLFFYNMENSLDIINDEFEEEGIHLICLNKDKVVGTGRLNIENETSIISQMAIEKSFQKHGVGTKIVKELIRYSKTKNVSKIDLSAREAAVEFYKKFDFITFGAKYPSQKTGIIHQQMVLEIE